MNNEDTPNIIAHSVYFNIDAVYPIGSLYFSTSSTNPATLFGGIWQKYGEGKMIMSSSDSRPAGTLGGETVKLTVSNLPAHNHSASTNTTGSATSSAGNHWHEVKTFSSNNENYTACYVNGLRFSGVSWMEGTFKTAGSDRGDRAGGTGDAGTHTHSYSHSHTVTVNNTGSGTAINILNPFICVNVWEKIG